MGISGQPFNNAWHPSEQYSEQWNFVVLLDDSTLVGTFEITSKHAFVRLHIHGTHAYEIQKEFSLQEVNASQNFCNLRLGENTFVCDKHRLSVHIKEGDCELSFSATPAYILKKNYVEHTIEGKKVQWLIPYIHATCKGTIKLHDTSHLFEGTLFHDHIRHELSANLRLMKNLRRWEKGFCHNDTGAAVFSHVDFGKDSLRFLGMVHAGKEMVEQSPHIIPCGSFPYSSYKIESENTQFSVSLHEKHQVYHGGRMLKLFSRWLHRKFHSVGSFSLNRSDGKAYVESLLYR